MADSTGQRMPLTHTNVAGGVAAGALDRYVFSSGVSPRPRRNTTHTSGPGNSSRTATARTNANSAAKGPFAHSLIRAGVHRSAASCAASWSTRPGAGASGATRSRVGGRPRPVPGGTAVGGRSCQTRVVCGTSAR